MASVLVWNNGRSYSDETIAFYEYAPLTKAEASRLVQLLSSISSHNEQYVVGFADGYQATREFEHCYAPEPMKTIIDRQWINDDADPMLRAEAAALLARLGGKLE